MTTPESVPKTYTMSVTEVRPLVIDPTTNPEVVLPISNGTTTLVNLLDGSVVTLSYAPTTFTNSIRQVISGPVDLVVPGRYRLTTNFNDDQADSLWAIETIIVATA